jgi:hypothetical protein
MMTSRNTPGGSSEPGEAALAQAAVLACGAVAVPAVSVAAWLHGMAGALGAAAGVGLALLAFGGAALLHTWGRALGPHVWAAAIAGGVGIRLGAYLLILRLLGGVGSLHRPSLAVATACATVVTLFQEMRLISREPRLFWVDAAGTAEGATR